MVRRYLFVFVILVSAGASGTAGAIGAVQVPADPLDELFARGRAMQATVRSLAASFTETTISSLLREPLVAKGHLVASSQPLRVLMTYDTPEKRYVLIDQDRLTAAVPARDDRAALDIGPMQRRIQKYFVDASAKELRQSFDITLAADPDAPGADLLDMKPKRSQIREGLARLRIWIDHETLLMRRMRMDYADGDARMLALGDVALNVPITDRTFRIPSGGAGDPR